MPRAISTAGAICGRLPIATAALVMAWACFATATHAESLSIERPEEASIDWDATAIAGCCEVVHETGVNETGCCRCGRCNACAGGRDVCCPTTEEVTETKSCWKVTCEKVCVPAIRLPWEPGGSKLTLFSWLGRHRKDCSCGSCARCVDGASCSIGVTPHAYPAKCGAVRCVSVLGEESYEVTECRCKWEIRRLPACCPNGCLSCNCECSNLVLPMEPVEADDPMVNDLPHPPMPQP